MQGKERFSFPLYHFSIKTCFSSSVANDKLSMILYFVNELYLSNWIWRNHSGFFILTPKTMLIYCSYTVMVSCKNGRKSAKHNLCTGAHVISFASPPVRIGIVTSYAIADGGINNEAVILWYCEMSENCTIQILTLPHCKVTTGFPIDKETKHWDVMQLNWCHVAK